MQRMKIDDDIPLEMNLVSRLVEQSQTRVEGANFDVRKHLLEYDDVLNTQRAKIYAQRNRIFADAYNRDPDFFAFYRSMQAYEKGGHAYHATMPTDALAASSWVMTKLMSRGWFTMSLSSGPPGAFAFPSGKTGAATR